jgi:hypothetical protein
VSTTQDTGNDASVPTARRHVNWTQHYTRLRDHIHMKLNFVAVPDWPALSWLARCERSSNVVTIFHGSQLETADDWFCEAAWAGEFSAGDFDQTDIVAGSGGRVRGDRVVFVSAGSTVDRLQSIATRNGAMVSNSLSCLVAAVNAQIDEASGRYYWMFRTIVAGTTKYQRFLPTSAGPVRLTYFDNLVWDGRELTPAPKPGDKRDFSSFDRYHAFLNDSMGALAANASDKLRRRRYELLSTASSGYDSSTVTVLAKNAGATQVLCFDQARRGLDDSGVPLARCLGLEPILVPRSAWFEEKLPEPPFLAADSHGGDIFFKGAEETLRGKVLLTGYHGDKLWGTDTHSLDPTIVRGDQSGLSLTEYRLSIGMLHCPVAFWGVRQIADIDRISKSPEMKPWNVPGNYNRPICRRIVESAGVPREMFGREKKASWVLLLWTNNFLSPGSTEDYVRWLADRRRQWLRRGRIPPSLNPKIDHLDVAIRWALGRMAGDAAPKWRMLALRATGAVRVIWRLSDGPPYFRRFAFAWALAHQRKLYPSAM